MCGENKKKSHLQPLIKPFGPEMGKDSFPFFQPVMHIQVMADQLNSLYGFDLIMIEVDGESKTIKIEYLNSSLNIFN